MEAILKTKLFIPPLRATFVSRARLIKKLNNGLERQLTLISAPAGFGKTTIVSEWAQGLGDGYQVAWLSLGENDNSLHRYLFYLVASLQERIDHIGDEMLELLQSPQLPGVESLLILLINDLVDYPEHVLLVLDDYHLIGDLEIHQAMEFLVENAPKQFHLVVVTREEPLLHLARLRARDQLAELRARDLRFTNDEAAEFLNHVMGLNLSGEEVSALEERTEGWIAGLQLAALSMRGRDDIAGFVMAFDGSHRYVMNYLIEEVLEQQPEDVQDFLLKTAILDKLSGSLCDALTSRKDSQQQLEQLEQANLFVIPLDNERSWYLYHHLFADLLRQKLAHSHADDLPRLHQQASEWYEQADFLQDAIQHAIAAGDHERTAELAERYWPDWNAPYQMLKWVSTLSDEIVFDRPVLGVAYAQALMNAGELEAADKRLKDVEKLLAHPDAKMIIVDEAQFEMLPASIATWRAYHARAVGDTPSTIQYIEQALKLLPEDDLSNRSTLFGMLALSHWANGELEKAYQVFSKDVFLNDQYKITGSFVLADMKRELGQLREAQQICDQSLKLAEAHDPPMPQGTEITYSYFGELYWEQGELEQAAQTVVSAKSLGEKVDLPVWKQYWFITKAKIEGSLGNLDAALDLLDEASRQFVRTPVPVVRPIPAMQARIWIRQGQLGKSQQWVTEQGLTTGDAISYMRLYEHITLAHLLIAQYRREKEPEIAGKATEFLDRLLEAAIDRKWIRSVIEILILRALLDKEQGFASSAIAHLEHALVLAEPEGFVQVFIDEGPEMASLLYEALTRDIAPRHVQHLLAVYPAHDKEREPSTSQPEDPYWVEPLSKRESEILALIAEGGTNQEVAAKAFLSLNTVKAHTRRIYRKLGVNSRMQAIIKARALGILNE